jgi:hypothetical protein
MHFGDHDDAMTTTMAGTALDMITIVTEHEPKKAYNAKGPVDWVSIGRPLFLNYRERLVRRASSHPIIPPARPRPPRPRHVPHVAALHAPPVTVGVGNLRSGHDE